MTLHGICPLCGVRKAKRDCPALGQRICAVCCATKRLKEINCPDTCVYLASARSHPAAIVQRRQERDLGLPPSAHIGSNGAAGKPGPPLPIRAPESRGAGNPGSPGRRCRRGGGRGRRDARDRAERRHLSTRAHLYSGATPGDRLQGSCCRAERRSRFQDRPSRNRRREGTSRNRARRASRAGRPGGRRAADLHRRSKEVGGPWAEIREGSSRRRRSPGRGPADRPRLRSSRVPRAIIWGLSPVQWPAAGPSASDSDGGRRREALGPVRE